MAIQKTWNVKFYQTKRGNFPVYDFISKQEKSVSSKIFSYITLLNQGGPFLKPPQIKKLQNNLYELRIKGKLTIRVLYTMHNNEYYLLHIFKKKSQKISPKEIKTAIDRMKEII